MNVFINIVTFWFTGVYPSPEDFCKEYNFKAGHPYGESSSSSKRPRKDDNEDTGSNKRIIQL